MLMMMGSAEALPSAPTERTKFIEDMSEAEAASAVSLSQRKESSNIALLKTYIHPLYFCVLAM